MFPHFAKLAPARLGDPLEPGGGPAASEHVPADNRPAKSSPSATTPSPLHQRDLSVSFNLLYQAIIRFSDPKLKAHQIAVDARLLQEMRQKLVAYESERLQLKSDLEYAHECAHAYWDRCKSLEAELDQVKASTIVTTVSRARSPGGVL